MSSDCELQRLSIVTEDKLNLPACLPDLYVKMVNPDLHQGGVGKRLLDTLFASAPTTINRKHTCKEQLIVEYVRNGIAEGEISFPLLQFSIILCVCVVRLVF